MHLLPDPHKTFFEKAAGPDFKTLTLLALGVNRKQVGRAIGAPASA